MKSLYGPLVDIVAPAWKCKQEDLERGMRMLLKWGLHSRYPKDIFDPKSLFSREDEVRFDFLKAALTNKDSNYVWCVRGGFGSIRLVPYLMKMRVPKLQKLFIGLSDITTLHLFFNQVWDWPTIHGPMLDRLGSRPPPIKYQNELRDLVTGRKSEICFSHLKPMNDAARKKHHIRGRVTGGNLITLQSSIATQIEWQTRNRILFLEEIGERGYKVDRVLEQMRQVGLWSGPKALVLGDFSGGGEPNGKDHTMRVLNEFARAQKFAVFRGVKSGHELIQRPVPFNTKSLIEKINLFANGRNSDERRENVFK